MISKVCLDYFSVGVNVLLFNFISFQYFFLVHIICDSFGRN